MADKKILIVEDEAIVRMDLEVRLKTLGFVVSGSVASGEDALDSVSQDRPDLILMDIMLAGEMTGIDAAEMIRRRFDVPIVFLTAYADSLTVGRAKVTEPYGYLLKPFDEVELRAVIEVALYKHEMEKRLRESENRYRTLAEAARDHIFIIDRAQALQYINSVAAHSLGNTPEALLGKTIDELFPDHAAAHMKFSLEKVFIRGEPAYTEEVVTFQGRECFMSTVLTPIRDESGNTVSVLGISRDITDRRMAENALRESEIRYRTLFDAAGDAIFIFHAEGDQAGSIAAANQAAADMHGYAIDELLSMSIKDLDDKDSAEEFPERVRRLLDGEWIKAEINHVRKDGSVFPVEISAGIIELGGRKFVLALDRDITGRKKAEEEKERLNLELRETLKSLSYSQKEWRETFDSITDMIFIVDRECNIIRANKAFAGHFGLAPRDVPGMRCHDLLSGLCRQIECPHLLTVRSDDVSQVEISDPESKKIYSMTTYPYHGPAGEFAGSICIVRDITNEREKEMRLIMTERLASLGQMASGIAHEINNPLAAMAGCAEGLLSRMKKGLYDPEIFTNYLNIITEEIMRCKTITTSMLSFVRKTTYELREIDINDLLERSLEVINFQGRLNAVRLEKFFLNDLPTFEGSEGELRQVFLGIISNALDSMGESGALTVTTGVEDGHIVVSISDTGVGISGELIDRIFDPFFTTRSDRGGTGLGLSIANRIVQSHRGRVTVESSPGKGSTFRIFLPLGKG